MKDSQSTRNLLYATMAVIMVFWGVAEFAIQTLRPDAIEREERITAQFQRTTQTMWQIHARLFLSANDLVDNLPAYVRSGELNPSLFDFISTSDVNDITAIYRNNDLMMWSDGFSPELHDSFLEDSSMIITNEVGVYLMATSQVSIADNSWNILRSRKIFEIANPGGVVGDVYMAIAPEIKRLRPTPFYIEGRPDQIPSDYRFNIITLQEDVSTGFLVLSSQNAEIRSYIHPELDQSARTLFFGLIMILVFLGMYLRYGNTQGWEKTLSFIGVLWGAILIGGYLDVIRFVMGVLAGEHTAQYTDSILLGYIPTTIGVVVSVILIGLKLIDLRRYYGFTWYPRTIAISLLFGVAAGYFFVRYLYFLQELSRLPGLELVDLTLVSTGTSLWIIILAGFSGAALLIFTGILIWFILNGEKEQENWVHPLAITGFVFSYVSTYSVYFGYADGVTLIYFWMLLFFGITYGVAWKFFDEPDLMRHYSGVRLVILLSFFVTLMMFPVLKSGVDYKYERSMLQIAQKTVDPDGWRRDSEYTIQSPYLTAVYEQRMLRKLTGDFSSGQFPENVSPPAEADLLWMINQHSYSLKQGPHFEYRELVMKASDNRIVLVQTRNQNLNNYLYSFIRLFVHLSILGGIFHWLISIYSTGRLFGKSARIHYQRRILDTYIISSFVFVVVLIVASHISLKYQNLREIELETVGNLDLLHHGLRGDGSLNTREDLYLGFDFLFFPSYSLPMVANPELAFSLGQSGFLPYAVYHDLILKGQQRSLHWRETKGQRDMLVGYRRIETPDSEPMVAVVAIPALTEARKYMDQMLQTISTLIVLYLVVFGLFILAGYFISVEIMRPIRDFREGLRRIASGQLDSMIPVNSQDEIGELANAYNMMVYKLKDLQEELAETERQSAWTEMARQVAHEIKNPLTPMKLSIQHLYQQVEYGEKTIEEVRPMVRKIAGTLIQEIDSLSNIASDFSKFARPIVEEFQVIPLNSMVSEVIELHRHDNRIEIFFDAGSSHVVVHAAVDEFKRVLINLIKNSVEAVGATGVVLIRTYDYEKQAFVEIVDNGCGMSRELQQKVFIPNFSTKNAGTGLGLAISKKIIDAHKGTIQCASAPGLGTTFSISLPLVLE